MTSSTFKFALFAAGICVQQSVSALDIKLPPETAAFKQDIHAEIANGQCLICHSMEYVSTQPPMPRAFWKAEVVKMQTKYGAPIVDAQVEPLVDYLTKNYGAATPGAVATTTPGAAVPAPASIAPQNSKAKAQDLAFKFGCLGCHNTQTKIIGPAYRDIAAKYKSDPDAVAKIDQQIHKGGSGKWGPMIMPPFPQVTPEETKTLASWILGLK
jgi:cytochrome c551/c552